MRAKKRARLVTGKNSMKSSSMGLKAKRSKDHKTKSNIFTVVLKDNFPLNTHIMIKCPFCNISLRSDHLGLHSIEAHNRICKVVWE